MKQNNGTADQCLLTYVRIVDVPRLTKLALATWRKFVQFVQNPLSRPTAEEVQKFNTEREYDKLIPKKG